MIIKPRVRISLEISCFPNNDDNRKLSTLKVILPELCHSTEIGEPSSQRVRPLAALCTCQFGTVTPLPHLYLSKLAVTNEGSKHVSDNFAFLKFEIFRRATLAMRHLLQSLQTQAPSQSAHGRITCFRKTLPMQTLCFQVRKTLNFDEIGLWIQIGSLTGCKSEPECQSVYRAVGDD